MVAAETLATNVNTDDITLVDALGATAHNNLGDGPHAHTELLITSYHTYIVSDLRRGAGPACVPSRPTLVMFDSHCDCFFVYIYMYIYIYIHT